MPRHLVSPPRSSPTGGRVRKNGEVYLAQSKRIWDNRLTSSSPGTVLTESMLWDKLDPLTPPGGPLPPPPPGPLLLLPFSILLSFSPLPIFLMWTPFWPAVPPFWQAWAAAAAAADWAAKAAAMAAIDCWVED